MKRTITKDQFKPWTPAEDRVLIENKHLSNAQISRLIPRSANSIKQRKTHLKTVEVHNSPSDPIYLSGHWLKKPITAVG